MSSRNEGKTVDYKYDQSDRALGISRDSVPRGPGSINWNNLECDKKAAAAALERAQSFSDASEHEAVPKFMLKSHVSGGFWLQLPAAFCKCMPDTINDPGTPQVMFDLFGFSGDGCKAEVPDGDAWEVIWLPKGKGGGGLSGGWRGFSIDNNLAVGDTVVFEKLEGNLLRGTIFRGVPLAENTEYQARDPAKVAKLAAEVAESKADGKKRRYAKITVRENAFRNALKDGVKYTPPGRLGSPKQQRAAEKAREQRAAEAAAEEEEFVVEKLVGTRKEEDGPREFQVKWWKFDKAEDLTWEAAENLTDALDEYAGYKENVLPHLSETEVASIVATKKDLRELAKTATARGVVKKEKAAAAAAGTKKKKKAAARPTPIKEARAKAEATAKANAKAKTSANGAKAKVAKKEAKGTGGAKRKRKPSVMSEAKVEAKKPKGATAAGFRLAGTITPGRAKVPEVGERVEVMFTDKAYDGTVLEVRKVKAGKKAAGKKKGGVVEEWEFKVHFDADDEEVWVGQSQIWNRKSS